MEALSPIFWPFSPLTTSIPIPIHHFLAPAYLCPPSPFLVCIHPAVSCIWGRQGERRGNWKFMEEKMWREDVRQRKKEEKTERKGSNIFVKYCTNVLLKSEIKNTICDFWLLGSLDVKLLCQIAINTSKCFLSISVFISSQTVWGLAHGKL